MLKMHSEISTPHPNHTTAIAASVDSTKLRFHSAPIGAPYQQLPSTKSRLIHKFPTGSEKILYYSCTVDPTMLVTLNSITSEQSKSTQETVKKWCSFSIIRPPTLRQSPATTPAE